MGRTGAQEPPEDGLLHFEGVILSLFKIYQ